MKIQELKRGTIIRFKDKEKGWKGGYWQGKVSNEKIKDEGDGRIFRLIKDLTEKPKLFYLDWVWIDEKDTDFKTV